jgi:hypothetical protein
MRVEQLKRGYVDEVRMLQRESLNKKLELRELNRNSPQNTEKIRRLHRDLEGIEISKENAYRQYRGEVSRTLNDRQRERYNKFCDTESRQNMRRFRQRGYAR